MSEHAALSPLPALLTQARTIYQRILDAERTLTNARDLLLNRAWELGEILAAMKLTVGHGRWLFWLGANWPELSVRNAQRCLSFFDANPNARNSTHLTETKQIESLHGQGSVTVVIHGIQGRDFTPDSIRKFMWGYVPIKERPELPGDAPIAPAPHPLTFVNNFTKWDRQAEVGLIQRPPVEVLRRDLEPVVRRIIELTGRDWLSALIWGANLGS